MPLLAAVLFAAPQVSAAPEATAVPPGATAPPATAPATDAAPTASLTAVTVALPKGGRAGVSAIEPGTLQRVTFNGRTAATVPVGAQLVSDPLDFGLRLGSNLTVATYLAEGQKSLALTSHPGSRTTSYLRHGDHTAAADLPGATPTDHWYLLSDVEVVSGAATAAVAVLGDSLTDGRGSTTNGNNRWPGQFFDRLQQHPATVDVAVLNQAAAATGSSTTASARTSSPASTATSSPAAASPG